MHFIMLVYCDGHDPIAKLEQIVIACKVPYVVVRNMIDDFDEKGAKEKGFATRAEWIEAAYAEEKKQVKGNLMYVSAKEKEHLIELAVMPQKMGATVVLTGG